MSHMKAVDEGRLAFVKLLNRVPSSLVSAIQIDSISSISVYCFAYRLCGLLAAFFGQVICKSLAEMPTCTETN